MAKGTNAIATEREVCEKNGEALGDGSNTRCCTKEKAIELDSKPQPLRNYEDNQLVKYSDVQDLHPTINYYNYYFTYTFFFSHSKLCIPGGSNIREGVDIPGGGGYVEIDSDLAGVTQGYIETYKYIQNTNIQAITTHARAIPVSLFVKSYTTVDTIGIVSVLNTTKNVLEKDDIYIGYGGHGFKIDNDEFLDATNYITYIAQEYSNDTFSDYQFKKYDEHINLLPNEYLNPYHIWVFEDSFVLNNLLGNDVNSYE